MSYREDMATVQRRVRKWKEGTAAHNEAAFRPRSHAAPDIPAWPAVPAVSDRLVKIIFWALVLFGCALWWRLTPLALGLAAAGTVACVFTRGLWRVTEEEWD